MNFLFRTFVLLGSVLVIALFAALIAPYFINWDDFKSEFEKQASRVLGQEVRVGGKTNLKILPLPFLSFEDLQVGRNLDGSPLMTVERFSLTAELLPFLSGEVRIVDMAMLRPRVDLHIAEDGTVPWTKPTEQIVDPELVNIETLTVENGAIKVSGLLNKREILLENIQGSFNAKSIIGPWRIDAKAMVDGIPTSIKAATGTLQDDNSLRLKLDLARDDQPYSMLLDGPVSLQDEALRWAGEFRLTPFSKDRIEEMTTPLEPLPVVATGLFDANPLSVDVPEYRMEIGKPEDPYTVTGKGRIRLEDDILFAMQADGRQIDVDQFKDEEGNTQRPVFETRLNDLFNIIKRIPVPAAKGEIDVVLPAIVAGDTFIRNIKAKISPAGSGWELRDFRSTLPGSTILEANGRLGTQNGFGFSGDVLLASRQPSGFADWVSGRVDETFRRLGQFGLSATLTASPKQATLENVELRMDDALLKGKIQRLSAIEGRAAILAELRGNRMNVSDLQALYSLTQNPDGADLLDFNFKVRADRFEAEVGGEPLVADNLDADIQSEKGVISINRLNVENLFGAKLSTNGRIENVLDKPNGNMKLALEASDLSDLLTFAGRFIEENAYLKILQDNPHLTAQTRFDMELDTRDTGEGATGRVLLNGITGGSDLNLILGFDGKLDEPEKLPITLDLKIANGSVSKLLQQLGLETLPDELGNDIDSGLEFGLTLSGVARKGFKTNVVVAGEGLNISANGVMKNNGLGVGDGSLNVTVGANDISPYVTLTALPVPKTAALENLPFSTTFKLTKSGKDYSFEDLKGQVSDNRFKGALALRQDQVARPRLAGKMNFSGVSLPVISEAVLGRSNSLGEALGIGADVFDDEALFGKPFYSGLDANLEISADEIGLSDTVRGDNAKFSLVMNDGAISLNGLGFDFLTGRFDGGLQLGNTQGTVVADLSYTLRNVEAQSLLELMGMQPFARGKLLANGSAETTGQTLASLLSNLSGNGFISMGETEIIGIDPSGFSQILLESGVEGYEITQEGTRDLLERVLFVNSHQVSKLEAPFSINRGKAKARNIRYNIKGTAFLSDVEIDLADASLKANTVVGFTPSKREAISGAEPQVRLSWQGPITALQQDVDTELLEGYLALRAFETSQRRLETLEADVMEKQRLRGRIAFAFEREKHEERKRLEALRLEEERQQREAEEARRKAEEEALKLQLESRRLQEEKRKEEEQRLLKLEAERIRREQLEAEAIRREDPIEPEIPGGEPVTDDITLTPNFIESIEGLINSTN